jgi:DNA-binding GntR family transcriptional regulator
MPLPVSDLKVPRPLAREEAYDRLRGWIIAGTLRPGELLRDHDIAAALGVSRTPVREALRRLQDEGFVVTALNRWTRVAPLDLEAAAESYLVLAALDLLALELAFARLDPDDVRCLIDANRTMRAAAGRHDPSAAVAADEAFHQVWIGRAGNGELAALVARLRAKLRRVELAYFDASSRARASFAEHAAVIRALCRRSLPAARTALRRNWRGSVERMRAFVQQESARAGNSSREERP